jgi:hypothetical protein
MAEAIPTPIMADVGRAPVPEEDPTVKARAAEWTNDPLVPVTFTL